jgi:hypothetical protein
MGPTVGKTQGFQTRKSAEPGAGSMNRAEKVLSTLHALSAARPGVLEVRVFAATPQKRNWKGKAGVVDANCGEGKSKSKMKDGASGLRAIEQKEEKDLPPWFRRRWMQESVESLKERVALPKKHQCLATPSMAGLTPYAQQLTM